MGNISSLTIGMPYTIKMLQSLCWNSTRLTPSNWYHISVFYIFTEMKVVTGNLICEKIFRDFLVKKENRIWRHLLLIGVFALQFSPEIVFALNSYAKHDLAKAHRIAATEMATIASAFIMIYINLFWLVPNFLFKKKYPLYFVLSGLELLADFAIATYLQFQLAELTSTQQIVAQVWLKSLSLASVIQSLTVPAVYLGATVGTLLFREWLVREQMITELQQVQFKTELAQLKSQINPHFLFNTLNNINTLIHIDPTKASQIVMGLSDVLRYGLYESNYERVPLKKEIEIHAHILELEKIRRRQFDCSVVQSGDFSDTYIPPFLFIAFVENAIKYSADDKGRSFIEISFHRNDKTIDFKCKNSIAAKKGNSSGGLGLANTKRRLELLYGETFNLVTSISENQFYVALSLPAVTFS